MYGWYIENKGAEKTVIISHGRGVNRLSSIQYLQIFKDTGLDKKYNFLNYYYLFIVYKFYQFKYTKTT